MADASGVKAILTPTVKLQTGGVNSRKLASCMVYHAVYSGTNNIVAVTDATRPEVTLS